VPAVLDKFKQAQQDVLARMRELEPMVKEYEELKTIAERLQLKTESAPARQPRRQARERRTTRAAASRTTPAASGTAPAAPQRRARRTARSRRSGPGNRRDDILRLVSSNPGVTINQLGKELKVDPTGLYRPVRALVAEGVIDKQGASLHPKAS
jgi:predicted HTH transcriptional regulator